MTTTASHHAREIDERVADLLGRMTLPEKIGQLSQVNAPGGWIPDDFADALRKGRIGSILNEVDVEIVNRLQMIAVQESRLGIPLLIGRDVIHGFRTVFPLPLAQASSWNPDLVRRGARVAAIEAAAAGVNWTFAPMVDIGRDPRWGRVAECLGEDPWLASRMAEAMVEGFQGEDLAHPDSIAACAKHFAGYGASEAGRDYNTTDIPERQLRDVHLPPFRAAVDAGVATLMASFSDIDGVPASANRMLMTSILREEWAFDGFVVSDWDSIAQLAIHGLTSGDRESAMEAANAGVDMEMASWCYIEHLEGLVADGLVAEDRVDAMCANVLRVKFRVGLFEEPYVDPSRHAVDVQANLREAHAAALESAVLLKNRSVGSRGPALPLALHGLSSIAVVGPLADDPKEQLGTWIFDGDPSLSRTPLQDLRERIGDDVELRYHPTLESPRSRDDSAFEETAAAVADSDVALLFLGEDAILSGEAHCRADIRLPGVQEALIHRLAETGTPLVLVLSTGRPLALEGVFDALDAILCVWHPGSMGGPAISDLLLGHQAPSGKLPVTFPRRTGQVPIYYGHKRTGKPPTPESFIYIDDIPPGAEQLSAGNTSFHLDVWYRPLFSFGHGLSYTTFAYEHLATSAPQMKLDGSIAVEVDVVNVGARAGHEVVQLYICDPVASSTRPVRELKGFRKILLEPGERSRVRFELTPADLSFCRRDYSTGPEPGRIDVWVGGNSNAELHTFFEIV
jgi:beta-glucosidase